MTTQYEFTCPECSTAITVDASIEQALRATGCLICNATIDSSDFVLIE